MAPWLRHPGPARPGTPVEGKELGELRVEVVRQFNECIGSAHHRLRGGIQREQDHEGELAGRGVVVGAGELGEFACGVERAAADDPGRDLALSVVVLPGGARLVEGL